IIATICEGESYQAGGMPQTTAGNYSDTLQTINGCDSIILTELIVHPIFTENLSVEICIGDSLFVGGSWQNTSGIYSDTLQTIQGCDSIIVTDLEVTDNYLITVDTLVCNESLVGLDTVTFVSQLGCDSIVIFDYQLTTIDSFFSETFTCDPSQVDTITTYAVGVNGECDSVLVDLISLAPSYEITFDTTTCLTGAVGLDTTFLTSVFGCDSIVIFDYQLTTIDSFFSETFTCDPSQVDTITTYAAGVNGECDSVLVDLISLVPSYEITFDTTTCLSAAAGLDTTFLTSVFGCDSIVIFDYQLTDPDTTFINENTCDTTQVGTFIDFIAGTNGACDAVVVTTAVFSCDTLIINSFSCNPLDTGTFVLLSGDSLFFDVVELAPTDSTLLLEVSCNPSDTGLVLSTVLQNQFGCDSSIFTYTSLLPSQNVNLQTTTCDPNQAGVFVDSLQNQFGCDSIVINTVALSPSNLDTLATTSCFFPDENVDTLFSGSNIFGCDSIVIATVVYESVMEPFISLSDISCFGEEDGAILIDSIMGGTPPYLYSLNFQPFQSSPIFANLPAGDYDILIEDAEGCQTFALLPLTALNEVELELGDDISINIGESAEVSVQLGFDESQLDTIIWSPYELTGCTTGNCLAFTITPLQTTIFTATITDINGCTDSDQIAIYVDQNIPVYIPNAFSPNDDNHNDRFLIYGNEALIESVEVFRVFDRWGEIVHEAKNFQPNDPTYGWDGMLGGKVMNPAVFVYYAEVRFLDGRVKRFDGDVTLVK
ncbi:MAG: gliding motility-associated C-terminal domain-containing protein, partial [Bacteroidota bacterium]